MNLIKKAIIPVAGLGTRMLPATKAIPKEMLPIVDKPLIQYIVNECANAGINEIVLVTQSSKNAIENHFDKSFELEATLEKRVKRQLLDEIKSICPKNVKIVHVRQGEAKGLGHAVLQARTVIGDNPFVVMLPDVIIDEYESNLKTDNLSLMVKNFNKSQFSQIMVEEVPINDVNKYGIIDCINTNLHSGNTSQISSIVEKPEPNLAPSNLAVVGRYVFSKNIWNFLETTKIGLGNEIQLTDAIAEFLKHERIDAFKINGNSHDCGSKLGYMMANVKYALKHPDLQNDFKLYLKQLTSTLN
jgi:UTP--glucose-1-phosphate uridylyltransferase